MENKLELKDICGYLPYGLLIKTFNGIRTLSAGHHEFHVSVNYVLSYNHNKPLLRPLSDLSKEIEHNVEKFTPLINLLELASKKPHSVNIISCKSVIVPGKYPVKYSTSELKYSESTTICDFSYTSESRSFRHFNETTFDNIFINNQLDLFHKLYEWHFDINGLIEKGLALNINDYIQWK